MIRYLQVISPIHLMIVGLEPALRFEKLQLHPPQTLYGHVVF